MSTIKLKDGAALTLLTFAAAGLRFYNLDPLGCANHYYAATILSMSKSWSNFFFAAAEPGGSVSVDKTPVGLWLQVISTSLFGINGFGLLLPQLLAGVLSVLLVYYLVRRSYGIYAGLLAGFTLAITPIAVAVDRNNTMDSTLIFTLLLAAWAFIKATETHRTRYLMLGAFLVGIGFNIKMLEAYLPLPAFFLNYFAGSTESLRKKIFKLTAAALLILVISVSWMAVVQATPSDQRPYIDNSGNNNVFELALGYNGLTRLLGYSGSLGLGASSIVRGQDFPGTGKAGILRLWLSPISRELSWVLPLGLTGMAALLFSSRLKWPLSQNHQTLALWGGWLIIGGIYISYGGFIHGYYLTIVEAPLAVLVAVGMFEVWRLKEKHRWLSVTLLVSTAAACLVFQIYTAQSMLKLVPWLPAVYFLFFLGSILLVVGGILETGMKNKRPVLTEGVTAGSNPIKNHRLVRQVANFGFISLAVAILLTPTIWSWLTNIHSSPNQGYPTAYDGRSKGPGILKDLLVNQALLDFLQQNTKKEKYLFAVPSSMQGSDYVLATGRPVFYIGGFTGLDQVASSEELASMVAAGQLRYIYWGDYLGGRSKGKQSVSEWVRASCSHVEGFNDMTYLSSAPDGTLNGGSGVVPGVMVIGGNTIIRLYDCLGISTQ